MSDFRLPRLQGTIQLSGADGKPTPIFIRWWQSVMEKIEAAIDSINAIIDQITQILVDLGLVTITADGALALAQSAINPDGTIKDEKVLTDSIIANGVTVPWYVSSSTVIVFSASPTVDDILSTSVTKELDASDLEVETQLEMYGTDAVNIDITCKILDPSLVVVDAKDYRIQIDGNSVTHLPVYFKFIFHGLNAGPYTAKITGARYNSNTCETVGDYFMAAKEIKR